MTKHRTWLYILVATIILAVAGLPAGSQSWEDPYKRQYVQQQQWQSPWTVPRDEYWQIPNVPDFEYPQDKYPRQVPGLGPWGPYTQPHELPHILSNYCEILGYSEDSCNAFRGLFKIIDPNPEPRADEDKLPTLSIPSTAPARLDGSTTFMLNAMAWRIARIEKMADAMYLKVMGEEFTEEQ